MALQMILGRAGSGKSSYLYEKLISEAKNNPDQTYLMLVPEQFTLSTQREFVERTENHCIMNIDVLSFERLCYRVFDELGISDLTVLEDIGKTLMIRRVVKEKQKDLTILKKNIDKPAYLDQVKSQLTEFAQYHVEVDQLKAVIDSMDKGLLYYKMKDLEMIYEGVEEYINEKYVTAERLLTLLARVAGRSKLLKNAVVAFDGYTGFTPVQMTFLKTMLPLVKQMYVTILLDPKEEYMQEGKSHELFYLSKKYVAAMVKLAKTTETAMDDPVILGDPIERRFQKVPGIAAIEAHLFRKHRGSYSEGQQDVIISHFKNPKKELLNVASYIYRYEKMGIRYQEMAIVTADMETYAPLMSEVFSGAKIPFFIDQKKRITFNAFVEAVKGILEMAVTDFSFDSVFRYLKSGMSNLSVEEVSLLENYCMAARVAGLKKYEVPFSNSLGGKYDENAMEQLNSIRVKFLAPLEPFMTGAKERKNVKDLTMGLYQSVFQLEMEQKLKEMSSAMEEEGLLQQAKEYGQTYALVMELLDKYVALMGHETMSLKDYRDILFAGLDATKVSTIPAGRDCIILGDIERTRLEHLKVLFFVGVNEGVVPSIRSGSVCLTQKERELLSELDLELAAGPKERMFIQQFSLYMSMCKPDYKLHLSYADYSMVGEAMKPAYLIGTICSILPKLEIKDESDFTYEEKNFCESFAFSNMVEHVEEASEGIYYFKENKDYKDVMQRLSGAFYHGDGKETLNPELILDLYSGELKGSVTRLECEASCSMQHFLRYGLRLKERDTGAYTVMDMGSLFHKALEGYSRRLQEEGYTYSSIEPARREAYVEQEVRDAVAGLNQVYLYENARNQYQIERLIRIVKRSAWALGKQMEQGGFSPENFEKSFKGEKKQLTNGMSMRLGGKIDRIDVKEQQGVLTYRIIDYKSGNTELAAEKIYDGTQLQLLTYADAAKEYLEKQHPGKEIVLDGVYYYHLKDPMVEVDGEVTQQQVDDKILETLCLSGVGGEEEDESIDKKSKKYDTTSIDLMKRYTEHKIEGLGMEIAGGTICQNPIKNKDVLWCDYCEMKESCGFDRKLDKDKIRMGTAKSSDVLEKMAAALKEETNGED
ncbi:MAG: exodeoxyribonuclease V subunit gamma [Lachnospiraceae bacterium]|nr:exodeoxyribonuclease V subunit gamma [Lachnospiraceae bacterium]